MPRSGRGTALARPRGGRELRPPRPREILDGTEGPVSLFLAAASGQQGGGGAHLRTRRCPIHASRSPAVASLLRSGSAAPVGCVAARSVVWAALSRVVQ